jgi:Uma2 family endonuclease
MTTQAAGYMDAIAHLPAGGRLILTDISWEEYEELLLDLAEWPGVRVFYDRGRLEIMSPTTRHEMYKDLILRLVDLLADNVGVTLESRGSTTFKQKQLAQGAEPDTCFYLQNADRIIGLGDIDLTKDPPPDILVEIDVTNESTGKFGFYAAIGVPEIWRYDERRVQMFHLKDRGYVEISASEAFPMLTSEILCDLLEQSKTEGQSAALSSFRQWLRSTNTK